MVEFLVGTVPSYSSTLITPTMVTNRNQPLGKSFLRRLKIISDRNWSKIIYREKCFVVIKMVRWRHFWRHFLTSKSEKPIFAPIFFTPVKSTLLNLHRSLTQGPAKVSPVHAYIHYFTLNLEVQGYLWKQEKSGAVVAWRDSIVM